MISTDPVVTIKQAADILDVSRVKVRRMLEEEKIAVRINPLDKRERLVPESIIRRLQAEAGGHVPKKTRYANESIAPAPVDADDEFAVARRELFA